MLDPTMTETISLPVWIAVIAGAFALWAVIDFLFIPGARWVVRRRVNRMIDELNTRLQLQIPAFQQTKRQVLIDRLTYDSKVMEAVETEAQESRVPREVLIRKVERYAREIVPVIQCLCILSDRLLPGAAHRPAPLSRPPGVLRR